MTADPIKPVFSARMLDWTGTAILYCFLLVVPFIAARWFGEVLPLILQPVGRIIANAIVLPFLYFCLHLLLRGIGARSSNFIALVVLLFGVIAYTEVQRALRTGDDNAWFSAGVAGVYALAFAFLTFFSFLANRRASEVLRRVSERAEAERQAEAFSKARQVSK
jgi:hypothetical protein